MTVHILFLQEQPSFEIEISSKKGVFGLHLHHCNMEGGGWDLGVWEKKS